MKFVPAWAWLIGVGLVCVVAAEEEAPKEEVVMKGLIFRRKRGREKILR